MADKFPFDADLARIKDLNDFFKIFEGRLYDINNKETVFALKQYFQGDKDKREILAIAVNIGSLISTVMADFLAGEGVNIRHTDEAKQKKLNEIKNREGLETKIYESALLHSAIGYSVFQVRKEDNKAKIEEIPYDNYYPDFSGSVLGADPKKIVLATFFKKSKDEQQQYVLKKIHTVGNITNEVWTVGLDMKEMNKQILTDYYPELVPSESTSLKYLPIFQINNVKTVKNRFGTSDYFKVLGLLEEINDRLTQVSLQFVKHLTAKISAPRGAFPVDPKTGDIIAKDLEVFWTESGDVVPQYIEYKNVLVEEAFIHIDKCVDKISAITQIPRNLLGNDDKGGIEKVESLKIRMIPLLKKLTRNKTAYTNQLRKILACAMELEGTEVVAEEISFEFNDGLPRDMLTEAMTIEKAVIGGFMSKRRAVEQFSDLEGPALEEELTNLKEDEQVPSLTF